MTSTASRSAAAQNDDPMLIEKSAGRREQVMPGNSRPYDVDQRTE
jgi:hypothetical protein